jgi:hypothetical protein
VKAQPVTLEDRGLQHEKRIFALVFITVLNHGVRRRIDIDSSGGINYR